MVNVKINGLETQVEKGTTILEAMRELGFDVPTLCHHPSLKPAGACRVCVVEQKQGEWSNLVTACSTPVKDGTEIITNSADAEKARQTVVSLLLSRWPNVPIIKEIAGEIGVSKPLFVDESYIEAETDACIRCGMCLRMCDEVVGTHSLSWDGRSTDRMVTTPYDEESESCIVCGSCAHVCPTGHIKLIDADGHAMRHDEIILGPGTPIHVETMQAIPNAPVIDPESCIHFETDGCGLCESVCEPGAIDFSQKEQEEELEVGSIILATGFKQFDPQVLTQYGYGRYDNVITGLEFEKMNTASGSTGGKIVCTDGKPPESVAILHCIGSRDRNYNEYCSRVCCMYALKFAHLVKEKTEAEVYNLYIDMRCPGKAYEEFYDRLLSEDIRFIRGKAAEISNYPLDKTEAGKLVVKVEDTLTSTVRRIPVDMAILCTALEAQEDSKHIGHLFGASTDKHGWFIEKHPKLAPVETASDGVFIAGCAQGPKDIPDTVAQGSAAASLAMINIQKGEVELEGFFAEVNEEECSGCRICNDLCPYNAIIYEEEKKVSRVEEALCKACGTCVSACPSSAIIGKHFTDRQILAELEGIMS